VDFSAASIAVLKREAHERGLNNITTLVEDITTYQPDMNNFDRALCVEVLQHLPTHKMRRSALDRIHASLRKGGILVTVNYRWKGLIKPPTPKHDPQHAGRHFTRHAFTEAELCDLLRHANFHNVKCCGIIRMPKIAWRLLPSWYAGFVERSMNRLNLRNAQAQFVLATGEKQ
jgi:2-polyprenyl-3-methyl-5-hydroxy-6-metoxy-1,4-benzoquinol methylase